MSASARPDFVLSEHDSNDVAGGIDRSQGRAAAGQLDRAQRDHARHRRARLAAAGRQGSDCAGGGVCAGGADDCEPADRSAAAGSADRGHHSRRDEEQHHSRRSDDGAHAADLLAPPCAIRSLPMFAAPRMGWPRRMAFRRIACRQSTVGESTPATFNDAALAERVRAGCCCGAGQRPRD